MHVDRYLGAQFQLAASANGRQNNTFLVNKTVQNEYRVLLASYKRTIWRQNVRAVPSLMLFLLIDLIIYETLQSGGLWLKTQTLPFHLQPHTAAACDILLQIC